MSSLCYTSSMLSRIVCLFLFSNLKCHRFKLNIVRHAVLSIFFIVVTWLMLYYVYFSMDMVPCIEVKLTYLSDLSFYTCGCSWMDEFFCFGILMREIYHVINNEYLIS